jgi:hypothetical protein
MNRLLDPKATIFDHPPIGLVGSLVRDGECLFGCVERGAHILAYPLRANPPSLVEKFDMTRGVDLAHEVEASSGEWQTLGLEVWDQSTQLGCQFRDPDAIAHLCGRFALQTRRPVMVMIPPRKDRCLGTDVRQIGEGLAGPERLTPQTVKRLDRVVAFGFVNGSEEGFHAAKQAQPHYPTDDSPVRMATTKHPFVVN